MVEHLAGYAQTDLVMPAVPEGGWVDAATANAAARAWCADVHASVHSETCAVPLERLASEREILRPLPSLRPPLRASGPRTVDRRGSIRFGSARYLVPEGLVGEQVESAATEAQVVIRHDGAEVIRHDPVGPGELAFGALAIPPEAHTRRSATHQRGGGVPGAGAER
jgi:hypothetical protein